MLERSLMLEWLRGELMGPSRPISAPSEVAFSGLIFNDDKPLRSGPVCWKESTESAETQEVLYFDREAPHRKYGIGVLHPKGAEADDGSAAANVAAAGTNELEVEEPEVAGDAEEGDDSGGGLDESFASSGSDDSEEFEVIDRNPRAPSSMAISACISMHADGELLITIPRSRRFWWQPADGAPMQVNGRYERCERVNIGDGARPSSQIWRRRPAVAENTIVRFPGADFSHGSEIKSAVIRAPGSPIELQLSVYPRKIRTSENMWLITVVLRNVSAGTNHEAKLYQSYFEASLRGGQFEKYPESQRPFDSLDQDEKSLALLYRESAVWAIGHGCSGGWDAEPGERPQAIYADVMPAVQLPSMTPDIVNEAGEPIILSMRELADLSDDGRAGGWDSLERIADEYSRWIERLEVNANQFSPTLRKVAAHHIQGCRSCLSRILSGIAALKSNPLARQAFRLANQSMFLQQISTKQLKQRKLEWNTGVAAVQIGGVRVSPLDIYAAGSEIPRIGKWRAFQIAFLLMSIVGVIEPASEDHEVVDLIWFPTGGGKTEAYLAVMAFYMFYQRLQGIQEGPRPDGTNVLMRYTLRMLTTQQFQRAASLICAMEILRRDRSGPLIHGGRFSLGLWIGGSGSPNTCEAAKAELSKYKSERVDGNPLILTECPWCRSQIGLCDAPRPSNLRQGQWNDARLRGITVVRDEGPLLHCTDPRCEFGGPEFRSWLPVEVIDERIYRAPPSLVIATADKLAMISYKPEAGAIFGRKIGATEVVLVNAPPGLIIQDELHLISGPLGTMYGLYEGVIENLCTYENGGIAIRPKLITSTATIRGAGEQIKAIYGRSRFQLFPSPGLSMGDSFFGRYARKEGKLKDGRLYLGIQASEYGSILTTQVRTFSSVLFRPSIFPAEKRDPWWSLLSFYNSIRELSGARTLFESDIQSRLKFLNNREGIGTEHRRYIDSIVELTSRLSQAEIVEKIQVLETEYKPDSRNRIDACLASNIIEVGVDIDRLSLMGVVGQPKTTAQYIQVTGRVGRRWEERPGLILMIYNPFKNRDRSHFEQFHSYHHRLYERVEPTSATPFAISAIQRGLPGALIAWARQHATGSVGSLANYEAALESGFELLKARCIGIQPVTDQARTLAEMTRVYDLLRDKWRSRPQKWSEFPQTPDGEYLMLWPGQFATVLQKHKGVAVPTSLRQVDGTGELKITNGYAIQNPTAGTAT